MNKTARIISNTVYGIGVVIAVSLGSYLCARLYLRRLRVVHNRFADCRNGEQHLIALSK